ncbi:DUF4118 domain-containing protein [Roseicella aerolata]|uniref:histidine kinase n=1 Tax=Roseicella aerolata TaxID=2883479 RepID=A0A9X1IL75_9PROT|nr:DUF4118 domain-containing protein [Roseicella aerolata]MCB4825433.1 DUF4118 domain-containing protein [Roseicella aerolata]
MRRYFRPLRRTRALPLPVRWAGAALLVLAAFGLRYLLLGPTPAVPYMLFLPAVILAAVVFGRGSGVTATVLGALLAVYFFVEPLYSFAFADAASVISVMLFAAIGFFIAALSGALHDAYIEAEDAYHAVETARREAEAARARAEAGERERDLLLAELKHRVKNDMQRIMSTMRLQAAGAAPDVATALYAAVDRVRIVAAVHDRLARRDGHLLVGMHGFLDDLVAGLRASVLGLQPVGLFVDAEDHMLPVSRAGTVGLVANELITNALKHAFPEDRVGSITIGFRRDGTDFLLLVADDGIGLPEMPAVEAEQESRRHGGMGRKLVRALAAQLGGQIETRPREPTGTQHVLRFPMNQPGAADQGEV